MKNTQLKDTLFQEKTEQFQPLTSYIRYIGIEEGVLYQKSGVNSGNFGVII